MYNQKLEQISAYKLCNIMNCSSGKLILNKKSLERTS